MSWPNHFYYRSVDSSPPSSRYAVFFFKSRAAPPQSTRYTTYLCFFVANYRIRLGYQDEAPSGAYSFWFCREPQMSRSKDFNTPFWTTTVQLSDSWDALLIKPNNFSGWICYVLGPGNYIIGEGRVLQLHHGIWVGTVNLNSDHRISSILQNYPKINQGKYRKT